MPVIVGWFIGALMTSVGRLVSTALIALGLGFVASKAVGMLGFKDRIQAVMSGAGPLLDYVTYLRIDTAITIILSAWAGRMATDALRAHLISTGRTLPPGV